MDDLFSDLAKFAASDRFTSLAMSPTGDRWIASIDVADDQRASFVTQLWEYSKEASDPRRLTFGHHSASLVGFSANGGLFFTSKRGDEGEDRLTQLRMLPREGGEAVTIAEGLGFGDLHATDDGAYLIYVAPHFPAADSAKDDLSIAKQRRTKRVSGILHESSTVRHWDHDLQPARNQVFVAQFSVGGDFARPVRLTPERVTNFGVDEALMNIVASRDASVVLANLFTRTRGIQQRGRVVRIQPWNDETVIEFASAEGNVSVLALSPDGSVAVLAESPDVSRHQPVAEQYFAMDVRTGERTPIATEQSNMFEELCFGADGKLYGVLPDHGATRIVRVPLDGAPLERLDDPSTPEHFTNLSVDTSGRVVGLVDQIDLSPNPFELRDGRTSIWVTPIDRAYASSGQVEEVTTTAADGTPIRAWLCLPEDVNEPLPLLMFIHGGPWGSWNSWSWRWNPWPAVARGYAVLLPDPAISTGYGAEMLERGWSDLGGAPYDDLMRLCDAAIERYEIDEERTAALGGSYGGFMANWIAGSTDRFDAIVSHAGLYDLGSFRGTTDSAYHWYAHLDDEHNAANSPQALVEKITTPMLIIHGDRDYRVPIGQAQQFWTELLRTQLAPTGANENKFLYFPDEHHWILKPGNAALWYETVLAFCDTHVRGLPWRRPELAG